MFGQPFATPTLTLEEDPSVFSVALPVAGTAALVWQGAPLPSLCDVMAFTSDQDCDLEFTIDGGAGDERHDTHFCRGLGFPLIICGRQAYAGQSGTQDAFVSGTLKNITKIRAMNRNTTTTGTLACLIGKAA